MSKDDLNKVQRALYGQQKKDAQTQVKFFKPGERMVHTHSNLDRKLQTLVDKGVIKVDQLTDIVAEHEEDCVLHPESGKSGDRCNCDVEIYNLKGERLA